MSEEIILSGAEENLKPIISLLIGIHQLIENRDIGEIVGEPLSSYVRAKPRSIDLKIFWMPKKEPPYGTSQGVDKFIRPICNIPDVARKNLNWEKIKLAAGGANGYTWGRFRATANLSNGRQMQVYGGSEDEAGERLLALAELSTAKLLTLTVAEEKKVGRRATNASLYKATTRIYPAFFTVINSEKILTESEREAYQRLPVGVTTKSTLAGDFKRQQTTKIPLWKDKEPKEAKALILEALRIRGINT